MFEVFDTVFHDHLPDPVPLMGLSDDLANRVDGVRMVFVSFQGVPYLIADVSSQALDIVLINHKPDAGMPKQRFGRQRWVVEG